MLYNDVFKTYKQSQGLYNKDSDDLAERIIDNYIKYVGKLKNTSNISGKHLFNGLVVGFVQSGKTMNFCHLINRAIDEEFQLIVIMSSNKDDLNLQTTDRIADDIVGFCNPNVHQIVEFNNNKKHEDFVTFHKTKVSTGIYNSPAVNINIAGNFIGPDIKTRTPDIYWLTACDKNVGGYSGYHRKVDFSINYRTLGSLDFDTFYKHDPKGCYVVVVKKNNVRLKLLYDFLAKSSVIKNHQIKALFIDDECDEITVSGTSKQIAATTNTIKDIQDLFRTVPTDQCHSMYVEYTATPIANICVKNRNNTHTGFPDDFIEILKKGDGYCGFNEYEKYKSIVINLQNNNDVLTPLPSASIYQNYKNQSPVLYEAILQFILNCKIVYDRESLGIISSPFSSMLLHTASQKDIHSEEVEYVNDFLLAISYELLLELNDIFNNFNGIYSPKNGQNLIDDFSNKFNDIISKMSQCNKNNYYLEPPFSGCNYPLNPCGVTFDTQYAMKLLEYIPININHPSLNQNVKYLPNSPRAIQVLELNSNTKISIPKDKNYIAVGGNKISRGLTLGQLSVSYFMRNTRSLDTYTQMARWFGYRKGYFDLCRLFVSNDAYIEIQEAHNLENELHEQIKIQKNKNVRPASMHLIISAISSAHILSGKQYLNGTVGVSGGGVWENKYYYPVRYNPRNKAAIDNFYNNLSNFAISSSNPAYLSVLGTTTINNSRYCYVKDVPYKLVYKLLVDFGSVSNKVEYDQLMLINSFLKDSKVQKLNVLLSGRTNNAASYQGKSSFANGAYCVNGMAIKHTVIKKLASDNYFSVNPFSDCPEDYVVDYDNLTNVNSDFSVFFNKKHPGIQLSSCKNRTPDYVQACKEFGVAHRQIPLMIITPFEFAPQIQERYENTGKSVQLTPPSSDTYYSIQILLPKYLGSKDYYII